MTGQEAIDRAAALGINAYPCPVDETHYHVGKDGGSAEPTARTRKHAVQAFARDIDRGRLYYQGAPVPLTQFTR